MSKPSAKAPAGWTASSDGRTWSAQLAALQASNVRDTDGHSFAGLVMLGASDDGQVLLDLDQAAGPISVDGPKGAVDGIVEAWGTELTTNPWSATVRVARINARNEPNLEIAENLLADLDAGERALIVFEEPPSRSQTAALRALFASATTAWILIKGTAPVATWKFTADGGVLSSGFLPDIRYSASPGTPRRTSPGTPRRRLQWKSPWVLGGTSAVIVVVVAAVAAAMLSGGGTRLNPVAATSSASPAASGAGKVAPIASASPRRIPQGREHASGSAHRRSKHCGGWKLNGTTAVRRVRDGATAVAVRDGITTAVRRVRDGIGAGAGQLVAPERSDRDNRAGHHGRTPGHRLEHQLVYPAIWKLRRL